MIQHLDEWEVGDTFAFKIRTSNIKYNNKYLIINKIGVSETSQNRSNIVRIKLAKKLLKNETLESLNQMEYIKVHFFWYEDWPYYIEKENLHDLKKYMNKYKMIFLYITDLAVLTNQRAEKFKNELIYLGNFNLDPPNDEFWPKDFNHLRRNFLDIDLFQKNMLMCYDAFNNEQSEAFDFKFSNEQNKTIREVRRITEEYYKKCCTMSQKKENEHHKDNLTYVGAEEEIYKYE